MDKLTEAFFKLKKVINNISLPEAKSMVVDLLLLNINVYLDSEAIGRVVVNEETKKFLSEKIGKRIKVRGEVNQFWRDSEKLELWRITVNGKTDEYGKIMVELKIPSHLRQGFTVSITGILRGNNGGEYILSCDKLEMIKPTEKGLIEEKITSTRENIPFLKEKISPLKKKIKDGVSKEGKPYSERYLRFLRNEVMAYEDALREEQELIMKLLYGLNKWKGVTQERHLKLVR
ncbi:MAG: hypothetical protein A2W23_08670 [Planctomycetes bacterium RBG_16_43_13]|nr:MAG: hypothetical protein A2W23_08670 [Planctomycetes bacterium RBG_16_43_13]